MSSPTKPRGGGTSELTKLKVLWGTLSDDTRAYWQEQFGSDAKQSEVRSLLLAKLKINLRFDKQLTMFRAWEIEQRALDLEAERQEAELARELEENPSLSLEQAREKLLIASYARAKRTGDFKLGLATVDRDVSINRVSIDKTKLAMMQKKADAYDRTQAALTAAKESKGGITPETLHKIEQELRLF
jgi:hypothetical protein